MRTQFTKLTAIFLAIFAIAAYAENAEQLKTTINNFVGCTGNLTSTVSANTVNITDSLKCTNNKILTLNIDSNTRVVWKAHLIGNVPNELIVKKGKGVLEIQSGSIKNSITNSLYNAIRIDEGDLVISGGEISAGGGYGVKNNSAGSVTITGGEIKMEGTGSIAVYNTSTGTVNISGGTIRGYYAIYNTSTGTININGGEISGSNKTVYCVSSGTCGKVNISPPAKITSK